MGDKCLSIPHLHSLAKYDGSPKHVRTSLYRNFICFPTTRRKREDELFIALYWHGFYAELQLMSASDGGQFYIVSDYKGGWRMI